MVKIKAEDLKTLKLLEEAWEDIEKGRYKVYSSVTQEDQSF